MITLRSRYWLSLGLLAAPTFALAQVGPAVKVDNLTTPLSIPDLTSIGQVTSVDGDRLATHQRPYPGSYGAVLIYERGADGSWEQVATLRPDDPEIEPDFGLALSLEGDRLAIGAQDDDGAAGINQGTVYLFERDPSGEWVQTHKLRANPPIALQRFGAAVDLDGDRLAIGAPAGQAPQNGSSVFVFERQANGSWSQVADLGDQLLNPLHIPDKHFGYDVDLEGDRLIFNEADDDLDGLGEAHVFERGVDPQTGLPTWLLQATIKAPVPSDHFARFTRLDGDLAYIGGLGTEDIGVYSRDTAGSWNLVNTIAAPLLPGGESVMLESMSRESGWLVAGNRHRTGWPSAGIAYLFQVDGQGGWSHVATFEPASSDPLHQFGASIGLSLDGPGVGGEQVLVGTPGINGFPIANGQLEVFDLEPLSANLDSLSLAQGGAQTLALDAGLDRAGEAFLILGSLSGTAPGFPLPGASGQTLALNPDAYFQFTLQFPGLGLLSPGVGSLDARGHAESQLIVPAGFDPILAGLTVQHAFVAVDPVTLEPTFASNPRPLALQP
jgi:hypothetical protein